MADSLAIEQELLAQQSSTSEASGERQWQPQSATESIHAQREQVIRLIGKQTLLRLEQARLQRLRGRAALPKGQMHGEIESLGEI